jgi:hypothetical protein
MGWMLGKREKETADGHAGRPVKVPRGGRLATM